MLLLPFLMNKHWNLEAEKDAQIRIQKVYTGKHLSFFPLPETALLHLFMHILTESSHKGNEGFVFFAISLQVANFQKFLMIPNTRAVSGLV